MIFVYIFAAAGIGIIILITLAYRQQKNQSVNLQNDVHWYTIDLVGLHEAAHTHFHRVSRPVFRNTIHKLLEWYLRGVTWLRRILRRHINALLDHYAEEHDKLYHKQPSRFIAEIQAHKNTAEKNDKDIASLDEYSQK